MDGIEIITQERKRQIKKGFNLQHDKQHRYGDLRVQAATILVDGTDAIVVDELERGTPTLENNEVGDSWGILKRWREKEPNYGKREIGLLSIAGALIAAEIDRILDENG